MGAIVIAFIQVVNQNRERKIERIINEAGRNGEPVIVATYLDLTGSHRYGLYSLSGDAAGINCPELIKFFNNDGSLYFVKLSGQGTIYIGSDFMIPGQSLRCARFPEMVIRDASLPSFIVTEIQSPDKLIDEEISPNARFRARVFNTYMEIEDFITGEMLQRDFDTEAPWYSDEIPDVDSYFSSISNDGKYFLVRAHSAGIENILPVWMYSIESSEWNLLGEFATGIHERLDTISEGGKYAAVLEADRDLISTISVIDTITGNEILFLESAEFPQFGSRWFCCLIFEVNVFAEIRVYDMDNNWEEYIIPIRDDSYFADSSEKALTFPFPIAMYEPPPDGLDGMYENYIPTD